VTLSDEGRVATQIEDEVYTLTTTGVELMESRHYWEVGVVGGTPYVGISRPNLDPKDLYAYEDCTDGWFIYTSDGTLYGSGKEDDDAAGEYEYAWCNDGDRVGVLLNLNLGCILFFKNGIQHGPGYPAGSVTGPVVHAVSCEF
jgi:hypothetical protein